MRFSRTNVVLPSNDPAADMGYLILESTEYPAMPGSTMCVATVLLETGMLPMTEPITRLTLESPGGLIGVECECRDGKVLRVRLTNQPAFVHHLDAEIEVDGLGPVTVDIAYGGMTFVVVDAQSHGFTLDIAEEAVLLELGQRIKRAAVRQLPVSHPENPAIPGITNTIFAGPVESDLDEDGREVVRAVVPSIAGRAWITSFNQLVLDPSDAFQRGFVVGKAWEPET